jgi:tetratricopeptide (TPR) repeat protein
MRLSQALMKAAGAGCGGCCCLPQLSSSSSPGEEEKRRKTKKNNLAMNMKRLALLLMIFTAGTIARSQDNIRLQEAFYEAEYFLMRGDYADALQYYQGIYAAMPDNASIAFRMGLCYLNIEGSKNLAIEYLEKASQKISAKYREGSLRQVEAPYEALFFLGDAYRINYMFEKAKEAYSEYRSTLLPSDIENILFVDQQITSCTNAPAIMAQPVKFTVESIDNMINDSNDNFFPVVSSDGKSIVYMTSMKFYDAIMFSRMVRNEWTPPVNITPELQSDGDHYVSCLSSKGNLLLLSRDDNINSDIYISRFDGVRWEPAKKLGKEINTKYWEAHGYITDDGTKLIFSSDRPGGFGGLDLYISTLGPDGEWGEPVNMGPEINTPFNDDRPFLIDNGNLLFFASQGHYNMGGYDIFRSELQGNGLWGKPQNIGYPLNTPDDDIFFCPTAGGRGGYMSMTRRDQGAGKQDIYLVRFR